MVQTFVNSGRIVFRQEPTEESSSHPMVRECESQPSSISDSASMPCRDWERLESGEIKRARLSSSSGADEESSSTTTIDLTEQDASSKGGRKFEDGSGHSESVQSLNANMDSTSEPEETMQVETDTGETTYTSSGSGSAAAAASTSPDPHSTCWSTSSFTNRSVGELRQLAAQFDIDMSGCIEKKDMVEKLVSALT